MSRASQFAACRCLLKINIHFRRRRWHTVHTYKPHGWLRRRKFFVLASCWDDAYECIKGKFKDALITCITPGIDL